MVKTLSITVQSHVPTELKDQFYVKPNVGQGRAGLMRKISQISFAKIT